MKTDLQLWQKSILKDILQYDYEYKKEFTLPRGSGVTSFIPTLFNELKYIYDKPQDAKFLIVTSSIYSKNYIKSFIPKKSQIETFAGIPDDNPSVTIITPKDHILGINQYYDWLISDGTYISDLDKLQEFTFNNYITFKTI